MGAPGSSEFFLSGIKLNKDEVEKEVSSFFTSKPESFYTNGIKKLPVRWQQVVDEGKYIIS